MEKNYKKWTKKDISILKNCVKKDYTNLHTAFINAGKKLGRTPLSCQLKWYRMTKANPTKSTCFLSVGSYSALHNRKVLLEGQPRQYKINLLGILKKWLKLN